MEEIRKATGEEILQLAREHLGERCVPGAAVRKDDADWKGPGDPAEFASWLIYQVTGKLYGCKNNTGDPAEEIAEPESWFQDAQLIGRKTSLKRAARTPGSVVLSPPDAADAWSIAISDGKGGMVEANPRIGQVIEGTLLDKEWSIGVQVPWINYTRGEAVGLNLTKKPISWLREKDLMVVQRKLEQEGFNPGPVDGIARLQTQGALRPFQSSHGLTPDGRIDYQTALALGIDTADFPPEPEKKVKDKREVRTPFAHPIAGFASDGIPPPEKRVDHLGIETDVKALCSVIAAKDVHPPLSIGLFGDWGTGKSFFMEMMRQRVKELTKAARDWEKEGRPTAFCTHTIQIRFNAWHYIDTNLWASLVTHIYEELSRQLSERDKEKPEETKKRLFRNVESACELLREVEGKKTEAEKAREVAEKARKALVAQRETADEELKKLTAADLFGLVESDPEVKRRLQAVADRFGVKAAMDEVRTTAAQARHLGGRLKRAWQRMATGKGWQWRRAALASLAVALPPALGWLAQSSLGWLPAAGATGLTLLVEYAGLLRPTLKSLGAGVTQWEEAENRITQLHATKRQENDEEKARQQRELDRLAEEVRAARQAVEQAQARVRQAEEELTEIESGRRLYQFIRERSTRREYQEQLGIISLIRRDFEKLSQLLAESEEEQPAEDVPRVDRIILYIDDLDRCPSARVAEVLQAVHLLLAFRLFVVVVGVDSRWLLHALEEQYSAFNVNASGDGGPDQRHRAHWVTTPKNYLEKIFQIPFTLQPMGPEGYARLIENLISLEKAEKETEETPLPTQAGEDRGKPGSEEIPEGGDPGEQVTKESYTETPTGVGAETDTTPAPRAEPEEEALPAMTEADLSPPNLSIQPWEQEFMKQLDELIPSPRSAKRLVNLYRLIKATVSESELRRFEGNAKRGGECQAVLLLLAMLAGFSDQAYDVFNVLSQGRATGSWWKFVRRLKPVGMPRSHPPVYRNAVAKGIPEAQVPTWERLRLSLEAQKPYFKLKDSLTPFTRMSRRVARFSFLSGRAVAHAAILVPNEPKSA